MKKTIIIIILLLYIASIVIVNFFGLEIKIFDGVTYVQSIEISNVKLLHEVNIDITPKHYQGFDEAWYEFEFVPNADGIKYTKENYSEILNPNAIFIDCAVYPHDADEPSVDFLYDTNNHKVFFNESKRTFVFLQDNVTLKITIKSQDGSNKTTSLYLYCKKAK